jgi:hypothetical protein
MRVSQKAKAILSKQESNMTLKGDEKVEMIKKME